MAKKNYDCSYSNPFDDILYNGQETEYELSSKENSLPNLLQSPSPFNNNPFSVENFPFGPIPPLVGSMSQDFTAQAIMPDDSEVDNFNLKKYLKKSYGVLIFYPANFTFVCPSELIAFNNRMKEFETLNTKIVAISVDSKFSHLTWKSIPVEKGGIENIKFPLVSDITHTISQNFRLLSPEGYALRGTVILDKKGKIIHQSVNDLPIGRNPEEILRIISAYQHYELTDEVCPTGWKKGQRGIAKNQQATKEYMAKNHKKI
ncbi:MAG: peroxiredoxin [Alphaproteobacteria bacterium]